MPDGSELADRLRTAGVEERSPLALVDAPGTGIGLAHATGSMTIAVGRVASTDDHLAAEDVATIVHLLLGVEHALRPRWTLWSSTQLAGLFDEGLRLASAWDVASVHRLLVGGWKATPGRAWAHVKGLDFTSLPDPGPLDLFTHADRAAGDLDDPVRPDGHLRPDWGGEAWRPSARQLGAFAVAALDVQSAQELLLTEVGRPVLPLIARSESAASLLCRELERDGLPMRRAVAEDIIGGFAGPRPADDHESADIMRSRDQAVHAHLRPGTTIDLRSPEQVKKMLRGVGLDLPDTRAWRLETVADVHPVVPALLTWRKAERFATTFGYAWLDEHLGDDQRLRGSWTDCDGAAGRMTASAGLHNMPAELRPAVVADDGWLFVRSDLGQIEPRVLAAVSGDAALARATQAPDLYLPIAEALGVERPAAKVAVLGAMYGQTTGLGAEALKGLWSAYTVAMEYLESADQAARRSEPLRTYGGRRIRMGRTDPSLGDREARSHDAARGRYGRNAMVQGAAAEFFKMWAVTVRARARPLGASVVLCLHDELLVHSPAAVAEEVAAVVDAALQETASRWAPDAAVRFVADTSVIGCWSDAKD